MLFHSFHKAQSILTELASRSGPEMSMIGNAIVLIGETLRATMHTPN